MFISFPSLFFFHSWKKKFLRKDCTAMLRVATPSASNPNEFALPNLDNEATPKSGKSIYSKHQREMYQKCVNWKTLRRKSGELLSFFLFLIYIYIYRCQSMAVVRGGSKCSECGIRSNLVACLDCESVFCDGGKGAHLLNHLLMNPSHSKLYSFKTRRQVSSRAFHILRSRILSFNVDQVL